MSSSSNSSISYFEQHHANLNKVALFVLDYSAEEVTSVKSYRTEPGTQTRLGESGLSYRPSAVQPEVCIGHTAVQCPLGCVSMEIKRRK